MSKSTKATLWAQRSPAMGWGGRHGKRAPLCASPRNGWLEMIASITLQEPSKLSKRRFARATGNSLR